MSPSALESIWLLTLTLALLSVYDKTGLLELAQELSGAGVRLLGSGGTAKKIRDAGIPIECVYCSGIEHALEL